MTIDQLFGAGLALVFALLLLGGLSRGRFAGPAGLAYVTRTESPAMFWLAAMLHLAGAAIGVALVYLAKGDA